MWRRKPVSAAASAPLPQTSPTTSQQSVLVAEGVVEVAADFAAGAERAEEAGQLEARDHGQRGGHQAAPERLRDVGALGVQARVVEGQRGAV